MLCSFQSNIDGTIVESLEEEIADLKERISDEQDTNTELKEEIQILKAQLSAFQVSVDLCILGLHT